MRHVFHFCAGVVAFIFIAAPASGQVISPTATTPPPGGYYVGPSMSYSNGTFIVLDPLLFNFFNTYAPPQNVGATQNNPNNHGFGGSFSSNGFGGPFIPFNGNGLDNEKISKSAGPNGSSVGLFATEMLQLDLAGLPAGLIIRESPTIFSTGVTTIADNGNGTFTISSFFDVFTELSLDGGQSWIPSDTSTHMTLAPEPTMLLPLAGGLMMLPRRRRN